VVEALDRYSELRASGARRRTSRQVEMFIIGG